MHRKYIGKTVLFGLGYVLIKWSMILLVGGALYRSGYWSNWYLLVIPVIGVIFLAVRRKMQNSKKDKDVDY